MKKFEVNYQEIGGKDIFTTTMECDSADDARKGFEGWDNTEGIYVIVSIEEV